VKLHGLRLVNFRQHADTALAFDSGLTGIIGPNGSGKTTILEGIAWALYGQPAARGTRDSIRHLRAGPRAPVRVELEFSLAGHRYRVVRGLTSAELFLDGGDAPVANSITGVSELLQRRLGMTRAEFFNTYFTGQKELNVMAAMGPSERAQFLSRVLGYERLRSAQALVRDRRKLVTAEAQGLRAGMPDPESVRQQLAEAERREAAARAEEKLAARERARADAALAEAQPRWRAAAEARERAAALEGEARVAAAEVDTLGREAARLGRELEAATAARAEAARLAELLAPLPALRDELAQLDRLFAVHGRRQALADRERALADAVAQLAERKAKLVTAPQFEQETQAALAERRAEFDVVQADLESQRTAYVRDRQEAETKLEALRAQFADAQAQRDRVEELGPESPCPTCTRPLGANFRTVLDALEEQADTLRANGQYFRNRLKQLEREPEAVTALAERRRALGAEVTQLERRYAKCQSAVQELATVDRTAAQQDAQLADVRRQLAELPSGYDAARHKQVRAEADRLLALDRDRVRAEATVARAAQAAEARDRAVAELARAEARLAAVRARQQAEPLDEAAVARARAEYEGAAAAARAAEVRVAQAAGERAAARGAIEQAEKLRAEAERVRALVEAFARERLQLDELDRAFSDLRTDLNFQLRPELSETASRFLADLTEGRYDALELDDQYNVVVHEEGAPKPVISGGEEDLANLVLRLAISQMIAERAGQSFSLSCSTRCSARSTRRGGRAWSSCCGGCTTGSSRSS
jgi:exonuclease SbcC